MSALSIGRGLCASGSRTATEQFPDPFLDMASLAMPENIQDALRWCEFLLVKNGPYREALGRVISYFITDVEILSPRGDTKKRIGREEKQKYLDFLNDTVGIKDVLNTVALDYLGYGNSFTSLMVPFRRYLSCGQCGYEAPLRRVYTQEHFRFQWTNFEFFADCPQCRYSGRWRHIDRRSGEKGDLRVLRWSPHELDILSDKYSKDRKYIWKIPDDYRTQIKQGYLFHLERVPWEVVQAVKQNKSLLFDDDVLYHMKEEPLAGLDDRGWGFSRVLTNFTFAWLYQVLWRQTEAIALDYVIPLRVLTPMPRPGAGNEVNDPVLSINMGSFVSRVQDMLASRRRDPARWNILPFPLQGQTIGGDASNFVPYELLELAQGTLLNAVGIPQQMYTGDLTMQTAPAALRLFEANWSHLVHKLNRFLAKLVEKISQLMSWEPVIARLQRVTHADDLNRQMAKMQLMMGGQISRTTGLATVGLDPAEEERRKLEEERMIAEATQDMQEEMEQAAQMDEMAMPPPPPGAAPPGAPPGGAPPGGAPGMPMMQGMPGAMPGGGVPAGQAGPAQQFAAQQPLQPNVPITPEDMQARAQLIAQQVMTMPESQKDSYLINLKREDSTMHALVSSILDEMRRDAELRGRQLIEQQEYGKQARAFILH